MIQNLRMKVGQRLEGNNESGFTLIELLVVMLILGILAAIAIPAFFNQKNKANDSEAKSAVKTAQTAMETYNTDNNGSYVGANNAALVAIEPTLNDVTARLVITNVTASSYTLTVTAKTTGNTFGIAKAASGATTYPCTAVGTDRGGCPSTNVWSG